MRHGQATSRLQTYAPRAPRRTGVQIEVTPEMIEAGKETYRKLDCGLGLNSNDIQKIYEAMRAASPRNRELRL
jgi:hypothetical protein